MAKLPRIYCDMDGVLCDFAKGVQKITGKSIDQWSYGSKTCLLYTSPSPRDVEESRLPSSA